MSLVRLVPIFTIVVAFGAGSDSAPGQEAESAPPAPLQTDVNRAVQVRDDAPVPSIERWADGTDLATIADLLAERASGTTALDLSIESKGSNSIAVYAGRPVRYRIVGLLTDDANEGLALFGFDLAFDGGPLSPAGAPTGEPTPDCDHPMVNFTIPWGITNPAGFGGTVIGEQLVQVGGGQNTINNTPDVAPFPIGPVLTGVAKRSACGPADLVTGTLITPRQPGTYTLTLANPFANVIREGETGEPFWATEAVNIASVTELTITTHPLKLRRSRHDSPRD